MVPATVTLLDALPRTANDKLDHRALPDPEPLSPAIGAEVVGESGPHTEIVRGLYADVLGIAEPPAAEAGFLDLGGHSLLAARLAARVREHFGVPFSIADVFRHSTAATIAAHVRTRSGAATASVPLSPLPRTGPLPLSPAQQRLWFLHRLEGPSPTYNIPLVLSVNGPLDRDALQLALHDLVDRHETLRTVYPPTDNGPGADGDGTPHQVILPPGHEAARPVLRLAEPGSDLTEAVRHCFDLAAEPPLRTVLFSDSPAHHTLLLLLHHIAGDGASTTPWPATSRPPTPPVSRAAPPRSRHWRASTSTTRPGSSSSWAPPPPPPRSPRPSSPTGARRWPGCRTSWNCPPTGPGRPSPPRRATPCRSPWTRPRTRRCAGWPGRTARRSS